MVASDTAARAAANRQVNHTGSIDAGASDQFMAMAK
jgi:hypothetical protein